MAKFEAFMFHHVEKLLDHVRSTEAQKAGSKLSIGSRVLTTTAQWCDPLTLQSERSSGVRSIPGRTPPIEGHDKG